MTNILAVDTSTDACSVALSRSKGKGELRHCHEIVPRQHNQRLFVQLERLLDGGSLAQAGVDLLAWAHGPGSFTGLRIAASAVQGLAFASELPVVGVSTLACIAEGAWRREQLAESDLALVLLDARIGELYRGLYKRCGGVAVPLVADAVCAPNELLLPPSEKDRRLVPIGNGVKHIDKRDPLGPPVEDCWPDAQDILPLAEAALDRSEQHPAERVQPVYLSNATNWKKTHEQGR